MAANEGDAQGAWQLATVEYNAAKVDGVYTVTEGDVFAPTSVTEFGSNTPLSPSEYTLVYVNTSGLVLNSSWTLTGKPGDMPKTPKSGTYQIAIIKGYVDKTTLGGSENIASVAADKPYLLQPFDVAAKSTSLSGVSVASATDAADSDFTYNGDAQGLAFYLNGNILASSDYTIVWSKGSVTDSNETDGMFEVTNAGTYEATLYAKEGTSLSGQTTVSFEVKKLDLSTAKLTATDLKAGTNSLLTLAGVKINNETIDEDKGVAAPTAFSYRNAQGVTNDTFADMNAAGQYTYKVSADKEAAGNDEYQNVTGTGYVTVTVYDELVTNFKYSNATITENDTIGTFTKSLGQSFNPGAITVEDSYEGFTYKVTNKDGQEFTSDWTNLPAGEYNLTITANPGPKYSKGGSRNCTFTVKESTVDYTKATYFVYVDGKVYESGEDLPYTGSAYVPTVVAKDSQSSRILAEGTDYTVTLKDAQNNVVEGFTDVADGYQVCIEFADGKTKPTFTLNVVKATIVDARATAPYFAVGADDTAAQPTFEGNTMADFQGQTFDLAGQVSPTYFKVKESGYYDADGNAIYVKDGAAVDPVKLTEPGLYAADVTVLANAENIKGSVSAFGKIENTATETNLYTSNGIPAGTSASVTDAVVVPGLMFEVSTYAGYADVDANQWYADEVYAAKEFGYMNGIPGTNLFMPEAQITRAQTAQVLYNMAGGNLAGNYYETGFSDVNGWGWSAKPIYWASQAGIVTGYPGTGLFGADDPVTREQAATMLYRYVKSQGKDVSATADLSQYTDGASVSDWAAEAMQWAVANDVFGVNTDTLRPQENLSRAEMAAIAVRIQPDGAY